MELFIWRKGNLLHLLERQSVDLRYTDGGSYKLMFVSHTLQVSRKPR